jgi:hypothetical protein
MAEASKKPKSPKKEKHTLKRGIPPCGKKIYKKGDQIELTRKGAKNFKRKNLI